MPASDIVVFLGPSLPVDEARRILDARYLSPARCGDVLRARRMKPRAIAIIDGVFESVGAVWHKEILLALRDGVAVYGAASMGALRAAELAPFGMIGIGAIFEAYRDGVYSDDDEVALLQGPAAFGYPAMSEAMVNIRATAARAVAAGVLTPAGAERLIRGAKATFYQERTFDGAIAQAWGPDAHDGEPRRFRQFLLAGGYVNQKRLDAEALLRHLAGATPASQPRLAAVAPVHRSSFILRLQHEAMCGAFASADDDLPRDEHVAHAATQLGDTSVQLRRLAQLLAVAYEVARGRALTVTTAARARVFAPGDFGLGPAARSRRWADARDLDESARDGLIERLGLVHALADAFERRLGRDAARRRYQARVLDLMRLDGRYGLWRRDARESGARLDRAVLRRAARGRRLAFALDRRAAVLWAILDHNLSSLGAAIRRPLQALSDEFRHARGLHLRAETLAWQRANNLDLRRYQALVDRDARLAEMCGSSEPYAFGFPHLAEPICWLLDAVRLSGLYAPLARGLCYGSGEREPATLSGRNAMAKAKAAAKKASAKKAPKDLAPKKTGNVKGGLLRRKVYE